MYVFIYYNVAKYFIVIPNRSFGMVTRYWLDGRGIESQLRRDFQYP